MGTPPVPPRSEATKNVLMGNRETQELEKAVAKFLRKLEAGKKDKERAENREKPARQK